MINFKGKQLTSIICSIPGPLDATSLYRGIGPMQTLKRRVGNIELGINPDISWPMLKAADIVFFQRPFLPDRVQAMRMCKLSSKPIWVDYDDNLHAIPLCNRRYSTYGQPKTQHDIATMVAMADIVTASTPFLAASLEKLLKCFPATDDYNLDPGKISVIPNAYDPEIHPKMTGPRAERNKLVVWRGSDSHSKDLWTHTQALASVISSFSDWKYEFIGEPFWLTVEHINKVAKAGTFVVTGSQDPVHFFKYLHMQRPALMIVPLEDQAFNRSKSNIAWIEATAAGAVTLAPAWEEWTKPGVITYEGVGDFQIKFAAFLEGLYDSDKMWRESRDFILDNLMLDRVNDARRDIVNTLGGKK